MSSIAENIKKLRESRGWSKAELARMIGKSRAAVSQYESGDTTPRMGVIEDLARVFNVSKTDIIENSANYAFMKLDDSLSNDERELISLYRNLTKRGKRAVLVGMRDYAEW